ncbi:MAG: fibrobacter succinogenes major paralogous domain-containing protein [Myxococcota bacterium]
MRHGSQLSFVMLVPPFVVCAMACGNAASETGGSGGTAGTAGAGGTGGVLETGGTGGSSGTGGVAGSGGTGGVSGSGGVGDCTDGAPASAAAFDIDCNAYQAVVIGDQRWFQTNLKTTRYRDGTPIATGLSDEAWAATDEPAYAIYEDDPQNDQFYGKLYNWHAVNNPAGLCPTGWRVPNGGDLIELRRTIDVDGQDGGTMKSTTGWEGPNTGATNSSGFDAKPGGQRFFSTGVFTDVGTRAAFWTSNASANGGGVTFAFHFSFFYLSDEFIDGVRSQESGFSVRCIEE